MALFGSKKNTKKQADTTTAPETKNTQSPLGVTGSTHIIKKPHITEKASLKAEGGVYVFEVAEKATKNSIAYAVKELYNVMPVRVSITAIPQKKIFGRGGWGKKGGGKKAYVYLKKGETIEFV